MRVGIVCPYSLDVPGGVQGHVLGLATALRGLGHEVGVLAPAVDASRLPPFVTPAGRSLGVPYNGSVARIAFGPAAYGRVRRWLAEHRFDVLHLHEPTTMSLSALALMVAEGPIVVTFHTATERSRALAMFGGVLRPMLEKVTARIAVSPTARRVQVEHLGGDAVEIPNGVDVAALAGPPAAPGGAAGPLGTGESPAAAGVGAGAGAAESAGLQGTDKSTAAAAAAAGAGSLVVPGSAAARAAAPGSARAGVAAAARPVLPGSAAAGPTVGFVGRYGEPRKGMAVLLDAFGRIAPERPGLRLLVVGPGDAAALRRAAGPVADRLDVLGPVDEPTKAAALRAMDVFCAPNVGGESFGMVVAEAMAAGAAVVASDLDAFGAVLGETGVLVPVGDAGALATALADLLDRPANRAALAAAARERARAFDWPVVAAAVAQVYRAAVAADPRTGLRVS